MLRVPLERLLCSGEEVVYVDYGIGRMGRIGCHQVVCAQGVCTRAFFSKVVCENAGGLDIFQHMIGCGCFGSPPKKQPRCGEKIAEDSFALCWL